MRFLVVWLVVCVMPFVAVASTAPWRMVAASSGAKKTVGSLENCTERAGQGPDDNEVLYFTKSSGETVHFVCQKDLCGGDTIIAILGKACRRNGNKCYENFLFECSISLMDDSWSVARDYNDRQVKLSPCSKADGNWFLDNVSNSSQVIVSLNDKKIHTEGYVIGGGSLRVCTAYACNDGFVYDKEKNVCKEIICTDGETRSISCTGIDNADKCTEKCVDGVWQELVSLDSCADGYRVEAMRCVLDIKAGDDCKPSDLPQFAKAGKYIKSGGELKCAATECDNGKYLVVNSSGASQGWCVVATYCQVTKKMGDECRLNIIDSVKTDLSCDCTESETEGKTIEEAQEVAEDEVTGATEEANGSGPQEEVVPALANSEESGLSSEAGTDAPNDTPATNVLGQVSGDTELDDSLQVTQDAEQVNEQLQQRIDEQRIADAQAKYDAAKANEQSLGNRMLGAASMGSMGIGGMMVASSLSEQKADAEAEMDMKAYLATFRCDYGAGLNIRGGETNIELPGAAELIPLYAEYVTLANDLKARKEQLGMKPGIESEKILDSATTGLYDDVGVGLTSGAYASLARALQNPDGEDAKKWVEQKDKTTKNLKTGSIVGGVGTVGGLAGDLIINRNIDK